MKQTRQTEPSMVGARRSGSSLDPRSIHFQLLESSNEAPLQRLQRLGELLDRLRNHSALPTRKALRSIDLCARAAATLRLEFSRSLAGLMLPLPQDKDQLSRKHARTYRLLADCYIRMADELVRDSPRAAEADYLRRACYRGLASLGEYLVINYERYSKVRAGAWLDIHRLYNLALAEGVQDVSMGGGKRPAQTVEHIYKRLLLLGLSDPFHQPFRGLASVYAKLDAWAELVSLTTTSVDSSRCLFTIDPALDRPGMPALSRSRIRPQFNERWLNTRRLVDHLKQQHHSIARTAVDQLDQPKSITEELDSIEQLRRMIVHWGIHPIRNTQRQNTYKCCDMVIGLKSVCIALNDFRPLAIERAAPRSAVVSMMKGRFDRAQRAVDAAQITTQWEIADESKRGLKVVADPNESGTSVSVGEIVAIRTEDSEGWIIGSVHWAQTDDRNTLSLGIKRIDFPARPAAVFRLQTDRTLDHTRCAALMLDKGSADGRSLSLVCDKSLYFPTANYLVRYNNGESERVVEASNVLLTTRSVVWFDARKPEAHNKQKALDLIYPK